MNTNDNNQIDLNKLSPKARQDVESWIVNSVKLKLIKKFEELMEAEGKTNLRQLFLVPIFTISELSNRVKENAPELLTVFYKELFVAMDEAGSKLA